MKRVILFAFVIFLLSSLYAININIEQEEVSAMVRDLQEPAIVSLRITNMGPSGSFQFYNLLGFTMEPKETVLIKKGETKEVQLMVYPREDLGYKGFYTLPYYIKAQDSSEMKEELTLKIMDLKDIFEVGSDKINPKSESADVYILNKENFNFENLNVRFKSAFFSFEETFSLSPNKEKEFNIKLNRENFKKLTAGFYILTAEVNAKGTKAQIEGKIKFVEGDILTETEKKYGFLITTRAIEKINEGNTVSGSQTTIRKNIISRLFTTFSPEPDFVKREGFFVYYTWNQQVKPGETLRIIVRTNWLFPLLIILVVGAIVFLAKQYSKTNLVLRKKVSFVKAKGGEFALKVSIFVNAKKYIERVAVTDRLPVLAKVYERFGGEKPTRVDEKNRRIEWNFEKLEPGEARILSYIIYSKVGVLGKFALPAATAVYQREGEIHETESNRAFFITEQKMPKED